MTLSSPKRLATDRRMAPRAALLSGLALALGLSANGAAHATLPSSTSFAVESQAFASGGGQATSTSYSLSSTIGQSSALGAPLSTSYAHVSGFQSTLDGDGDDYPNHLDAFPNDPTEWVDTDGDGTGNNADTDDDNDGMPDAYENGFVGLDPLVDDAAGDVDGDGYSNLEEYIAGTDPTLETSRPIQMTDFNYDFQSDIFWRRSSDGKNIIWTIDNFAKVAADSVLAVPSPWYITELADFDDDGLSDILWRNSTTNAVSVWLMDGNVRLASGQIGSVSENWVVKGVADFDGDGMADILWYNENNGTTLIWQMNGLTKLYSQSIGAPPVAWQIKGVGDFNDDDRADILWHNSATGTAIVWQINFVSDVYVKEAAATIGAAPPVWRIEGIVDFNGGGRPDILWRNTSNFNLAVWQINDYVKEAGGLIGNVGLNWNVARLGDYNGGGQGDILWRNPSTGANIIWEMDGLSKVATHSLSSVLGWSIE